MSSNLQYCCYTVQYSCCRVCSGLYSPAKSCIYSILILLIVFVVVVGVLAVTAVVVFVYIFFLVLKWP
jgi:hypothetical protein